MTTTLTLDPTALAAGVPLQRAGTREVFYTFPVQA